MSEPLEGYTSRPIVKQGLTFRVVTREEWAELDAHWAQEAKELEVRKAVLDACTHDWYLYTEHPNAHGPGHTGHTVEIFCESCHGSVTEVYGDCLDLVYLEFDDVIIDGGRHNLTDRLATVPVDITTWSSKRWTDYGYEYDWGIEVEVLGSAQYKEIEDGA